MRHLRLYENWLSSGTATPSRIAWAVPGRSVFLGVILRCRITAGQTLAYHSRPPFHGRCCDRAMPKGLQLANSDALRSNYLIFSGISYPGYFHAVSAWETPLANTIFGTSRALNTSEVRDKIHGDLPVTHRHERSGSRGPD